MIPYVLATASLDDLDAIHAYIAKHNIDAADRLLKAAFDTFDLLSCTPEIGRVRKFRGDASVLRSFGIRGYANHLIFYRLRSNHLEIVRVLHGAQDLNSILDPK